MMKITTDMIEAAASALADMDNVPPNVRLGDVYTRTEAMMEFADWIAELNAEAIRKGYRSPHPVSDGCEQDWRPYYEDGYSPKDALEADEMN